MINKRFPFGSIGGPDDIGWDPSRVQGSFMKTPVIDPRLVARQHLQQMQDRKGLPSENENSEGSKVTDKKNGQ